ncbi:flagellar hook-length control protein FliK [Sphaerotilus sp.]|uniref:flagellar hook-length control protein FliK n=1 Tax=Sphaerotilus sp. TaxID=2093942 RepID=UPI0034E2150B
MDSPLLNLAPAPTHAHGRGPAAHGAAETRADPGGFARMLQAAVAPETATAATDAPATAAAEAVPDPGAAPMACGKAPDVPGLGTGAVGAPNPKAAAMLLRRSLAAGPDRLAEAARSDVHRPADAETGLGTVGADAEPVAAEATAATDTATDTAGRSSRSKAKSPDAGDPAASSSTSTSLMQWMLQMASPAAMAVPTPAPVAAPAAEPGRLGLGRQEGDSLLQAALPAGLLGRSEPVGPDREVRGSGAGRHGKLEAALAATDGSGDQATAAERLPGASRKPEVPSAMPAAPLPTAESVAGAGVLPPPQVPATPSVGPAESSRSTAQESVQGVGAAASSDAQALLSAAQAVATAAAAATPTAMAGGSPVVAPAQTWIQTPVTQPGFSDEVVVALVRRAGQAEQGRQEVTLHLNPAEMGPVSVSLELNGSTARIEFGASEALTRHHLEATLSGLTEAFRDEGLSLTHSRVHEVSKDALAASAAGSGSSDLTGAGSGSAGSDARSRSDAFMDGRSGFGDRAPRRQAEMFSIDGRAVGTAREPLSIGPSPGRAGRLDLFA